MLIRVIAILAATAVLGALSVALSPTDPVIKGIPPVAQAGGYEDCVQAAEQEWEDCIEDAWNHTHGGFSCEDISEQQSRANVCHWANLDQQRTCYWSYCPVGGNCTM